jgi:tetratricopeptide (TPR) repeat protein
MIKVASMIKKIREFLSHRKSKSIRNEYLEQIKKNPQDTRSRLKLGDLHAKRGETAEAAEQYMASAEVFAQAGFHLKSIALYKQVLKLQHESAQALRRLAQLSLQYGLYADAYPYHQSLAELLRSKEDGQRFFAIFQEVSNLQIKDLRHKALLIESIFPDPDGQLADPCGRMCVVARAMSQDERLETDAQVLLQWLSITYPQETEAHEILVTLLQKSGAKAELEQALQRLKELYRTTGQLEKKESFLRQFEETEDRTPSSSEALDGKPAMMGKARPDQVKVKMEADVYELLRKKAETREAKAEQTAPGPDRRLPRPSHTERLQFEDLFSTFKEGIREQVGRGDHETHYNLGIAYQEMGLYEDAIQEFEAACGDPALQPDACFLMGKCSAEMEKWEDAIGQYERALAAEGLDSEKSRGIRYELALVLRSLGRDEDALRTFQQIHDDADNYRDTERQIEELLRDSHS